MTLKYDWFNERTDKVALMMPCTINNSPDVAAFNGDMKKSFAEQGIFEAGGPNWYVQAGKIAELLGLEAIAFLMG